MKFFENDVVLLLAFLLLFGLGLTFFRGDSPDNFFTDDPFDSEEELRNKSVEPVKPAEVAALNDSVVIDSSINYDEPDLCLADLSQEQLLNYMKPLFLTRSASAIISFLNHIPVASVFRIVKAIIESSHVHLPSRVKLRLIFAGAQRQKEKTGKFEFFDLVVNNETLQTGVKPFIVKAVEAGYAHLVPDILLWAEGAHVGNVVREALVYVVHYDDEDPEALRELFEAGVPISKSMASELLWELVDTCSQGHSIPFLVSELSADVQYVKNETTPLVRAVQGGKLSLVNLLLEYGAQPGYKATIKSAEKTALEVAREKGNKQVIAALEEHKIKQ